MGAAGHRSFPGGISSTFSILNIEDQQHHFSALKHGTFAVSKGYQDHLS